METSKLRVLVVADDLAVRADLAARLAEHPACEVVEQTGADFAVAGYDADVVVWDLSSYPGGAGIPDDLDDAPAPVVAVVADEAGATAARAGGARACLLPHSDPQRLVAAAQAVARGLVVVDPALASSWPTRDHEADPPLEELTVRELEVLRLLAEGLPNKVIAARLGITDNTVKFHVNTIFGKLGAHSRTEAVTRAARTGLLVL